MVEHAKIAEVDRLGVGVGLLGIGRKTLELEAIDGQMQRELDDVRARYSARIESRTETIRTLVARLEQACNRSRAGLLKRGSKSLKTLFGRVFWRLSPDRIGTLQGISADQATANLVRRGHLGLVRIRKEPNKPGIKSAVLAGEIEDAELRACGIVVKLGEENFAYSLDRVAVSKRIAEGN